MKPKTSTRKNALLHRGDYSDMIAIGRIAFKNNVKAITTLELNGQRAHTISGWLKQTRNFYHAILANEEWKTNYATYGQTEEKITGPAGCRSNRFLLPQKP